MVIGSFVTGRFVIRHLVWKFLFVCLKTRKSVKGCKSSDSLESGPVGGRLVFSPTLRPLSSRGPTSPPSRRQLSQTLLKSRLCSNRLFYRRQVGCLVLSWENKSMLFVLTNNFTFTKRRAKLHIL